MFRTQLALSLCLIALPATPARGQCLDTLAHLSTRLPQINTSDLTSLRATVLSTRMSDIERELARTGTAVTQAIALTRQQSSAYEETMRQSRECAIKVFAGDAAGLGAALDARQYFQPIPGGTGQALSVADMIGSGPGNILTSCLSAYVATDMARIASDETVKLLSCRSSIAGAAGTASAGGGVWELAPAERQSGLASRSASSGDGAALSEALADFNRQMRQRQVANASPEMAVWMARQDATQAMHDANLAATSAGIAEGAEAARKGSVNEQLAMVEKAVKSWRAPLTYAGVASGGIVLADPYAAVSPASGGDAAGALADTGLVWDAARHVAKVAQATLCDGRLRVGDYPVLDDGNLLDTAERVRLFIALCSDRHLPLIVVVDNGDVENRP